MDDQGNLRSVRRIGMLRRRWHWILGSAGTCAAGALAVSLLLPKIYRATTYLLVSESKIGTTSREVVWQQMAALPTFIPFVDNDALISQAITKFHLDRPPYNLTVTRFRRKDYLDVRIPKSTRLLKLDVEFPDAQLAANLANELAQSAVEFNDRMNQADTLSTREFLKKQLDETTDRMAQAATRRLKVQHEARIEDREKDLSILLSEKDRLSTRLEQLRLDLAQDQSRSKSLQQALTDEPQTFLLKKSVTADPFLERAAEKLNPNGSPLSMTEEYLNVTRQQIQRDLVGAAANSAGERAGIETATERLKVVNKQIADLLSTLTNLRNEIDKGDREYSLAYDAVKNATREYQDVSVNVSSKSQDMKQVAPALVPERPVRPRILLNTLVGFVLGAMICAGLAVGLENYGELRRTRSFAIEEADPVTVQRD